MDDVLEYATVSAFPAQGEAGKIYVATQTNLTYRWSGTGYVEISPSLALGGTSSTAFPGDRGVTLETKVSNILDGGLKVAKAASADTSLEASHATTADTATQATNADYANSATNASYAVHAQEADKATSDGEGNDIASTYLKLSGGTMTGTLVQKKATAPSTPMWPHTGYHRSTRGGLPWIAGSIMLSLSLDTSPCTDITLELCPYRYLDTLTPKG